MQAELGTGPPKCLGRGSQVHNLGGQSTRAAFPVRTSRNLVCTVQCLFPEQPQGTRGDMSHFLDSNLYQLLSHFGLSLSQMYLLFQVHFYFLPVLSPCQVCATLTAQNSV